MKGKAEKGKSGNIKTTDMVDYVKVKCRRLPRNNSSASSIPSPPFAARGIQSGRLGCSLPRRIT
jgi:hypothetical protein